MGDDRSEQDKLDRTGVEPEAESGAGYGSHAPAPGERHEDETVYTAHARYSAAPVTITVQTAMVAVVARPVISLVCRNRNQPRARAAMSAQPPVRKAGSPNRNDAVPCTRCGLIG